MVRKWKISDNRPKSFYTSLLARTESRINRVYLSFFSRLYRSSKAFSRAYLVYNNLPETQSSPYLSKQDKLYSLISGRLAPSLLLGRKHFLTAMWGFLLHHLHFKQDVLTFPPSVLHILHIFSEWRYQVSWCCPRSICPLPPHPQSLGIMAHYPGGSRRAVGDQRWIIRKS